MLASDITDLALIVGAADVIVYAQVKGTTRVTTAYKLASATKWVSAAALLRLVEQGALSLGDRPQDFLAWWTEEVSDARRRMDLHDMLAFVAGFVRDAQFVPCLREGTITVQDCARYIHDERSAIEPGVGFDYSPAHLQVAAAMAEVATGKPWVEVFDEALRVPWAFRSPVSSTPVHRTRGWGAAR